jgi:tripartite-type tricarboxylate transporter receptor subunit TctC
MRRREFITLLAGILALACGGGSAAIAQGYPAAPVKLIVTTGAGGAPDVIARIVAEGLSRRWGQQVFVANHPGAAGSIGMKVAGAASPDGYTLLFALSSSFVALPEIAKDYPLCGTSCRSASSASSRWRSRCSPPSASERSAS